MELRKTEAVRILYYHQRCLRHVDSDLNDRCRDENACPALGKIRHSPFLVRRLHLSVDESHRNVGKERGEPLRRFGSCMQLTLILAVAELLVLCIRLCLGGTDRGTDDIYSVPREHGLSDEGIESFAVALTDGKGVYLLSAGRQLVESGYRKIAVQNK